MLNRRRPLRLRNSILGRNLMFLSPERIAMCRRRFVQTRWVLSWKMVDGHKGVKARLVAEGYQDAYLRGGVVDATGCVSPRPPHLKATSLCADRNLKLGSLVIENAFLQVDGLTRDVFLQAPMESELSRPSCARKLKEPASGLNR